MFYTKKRGYMKIKFLLLYSFIMIAFTCVAFSTAYSFNDRITIKQYPIILKDVIKEDSNNNYFQKFSSFNYQNSYLSVSSILDPVIIESRQGYFPEPIVYSEEIYSPRYSYPYRRC